MHTVEITQQNFDTLVMQSGRTVLLDFWATWCGPCRMVAPTIEEIAAEHPEIVVGKIDVDAQPELAKAFGVMSIPSLFVLKDGKVVSRCVGVKPKAAILAMLP